MQSPLLEMLTDSVSLYCINCIYPYFILVKTLQALEGEVFLYGYLLHPVHKKWFSTSASGEKNRINYIIKKQ